MGRAVDNVAYDLAEDLERCWGALKKNLGEFGLDPEAFAAETFHTIQVQHERFCKLLDEESGGVVPPSGGPFREEKEESR